MRWCGKNWSGGVAKVLLFDSPSWTLFSPQMHLHLGIFSLAASLRLAGHDVRVLDCHKLTSWDATNGWLVIHREAQEDCDVLGISATTGNVHWGMELAESWPARFKILGGPHVTHILKGSRSKFWSREYFCGFNFVMAGEAEESLVAFCNAIDRGDDPRQAGIPGLAWWDGGVIHIMPQPRLPDVTRLPPPAFDLWGSEFAKGTLSVNSIQGRELDASRLLNAPISAARGCPYSCAFCAAARAKLRETTLIQVEVEARNLVELGVGTVHIRDETFTVRAERVRKIADILHAHGLLWRACTRSDLRNRELFEYIAKRGCGELGFGVEHASARMLKLMNKGITPEANEDGIKMCQDSGMAARAFLMVGFPGETLDTIEELRGWVLRIRPDMVALSVFQPYPGSDVWEHPERYGVELPSAPFEYFWQQGLDNSEDRFVLNLAGISKRDLFLAYKELAYDFEEHIGHRDRTRLQEKQGGT